MTTTTTKAEPQQAIATTGADPFAAMLERQRGEILKLADGLDPDRLFSLVLLAARKDNALAQCTPASIVNAIRDSARLGLQPDGIQGALIRYGRELQFQPMYRGLIDLAYARGVVTMLDAAVVYDCDEFETSRSATGEVFHHRQNWSGPSTKKPIAYYAFARLPTGAFLSRVMSADEMNEHERQYARGGGPWKTAPMEMRFKTVIKKLYKRLPCDIKMRDALIVDNAVYDMPAATDDAPAPKKRGAALLEEVGAKKSLPPASEPAPPVVETQQKPPQSAPPSAPVVAPPPPAEGQDEAPWTDDGGQPIEPAPEATPDEPAPAEDHQAPATAPVPEVVAPIVEAPRPLPATVEADYAVFVEAITTMPYDPHVTSAMSKHVGKYKARFSPGQYEAMTMLGKGVVNVGAKKLPAVDGMTTDQLASFARGLAVIPNPLTRLVATDPTTSILAFEGMTPATAALLKGGTVAPEVALVRALATEGDGAANAG